MPALPDTDVGPGQTFRGALLQDANVHVLLPPAGTGAWCWLLAVSVLVLALMLLMLLMQLLVLGSTSSTGRTHAASPNGCFLSQTAPPHPTPQILELERPGRWCRPRLACPAGYGAVDDTWPAGRCLGSFESITS